MTEKQTRKRPRRLDGDYLSCGITPVDHAGSFKANFLERLEYGTLSQIRDKVYRKGFAVPTPGQALSLIDDALRNPEEEFFAMFLAEMRTGNPLILDAGILKDLGGFGTYVYDHPAKLSADGDPVMDRKGFLHKNVNQRAGTAVLYGPQHQLARSVDGSIRWSPQFSRDNYGIVPKDKIWLNRVINTVAGEYGARTMVEIPELLIQDYGLEKAFDRLKKESERQAEQDGIEAPNMIRTYMTGENNDVPYVRIEGSPSINEDSQISIPSIRFNEEGVLVFQVDKDKKLGDKGFSVPLIWATKAGTKYFEHLIKP